MSLSLSILFLMLSAFLGWVVFGPMSSQVGLWVHGAFLACVGCFLWTLVRTLSSHAQREMDERESDEEAVDRPGDGLPRHPAEREFGIAPPRRYRDDRTPHARMGAGSRKAGEDRD